MNNATYYAQLEEGARYLASRAASDAERRLHLGWANRYRRLVADAQGPRRKPLSPAAAAATPTSLAS